MVVGIVAHVDAGKTTLSEALLYQTGQIRTLGRVDHGDAYLDTDSQERERGITIFSKQARMEFGKMKITLLDTPGHVDFSAEMERALQVLDYAILVISGTDGVQGHTRTLWRLLRHYGVPVFLFINKMDLAGTDKESVRKQLQSELSDGCVDFSGKLNYEDLAVCEESLLNEYMENETIQTDHIADAIAERKVFPCFYGSALKLDGITDFLHGMETYMKKPVYPQEFSARVYKIGRDVRGTRLTFLKVTGGALHVKEPVSYKGLIEKTDQIRLYSGEKFEMVQEVSAGEVCAVSGLTETYPGLGLGVEENESIPVLEPVLNYRIQLPDEVNPADMMQKLKQLEEEDPQLNIVWNERLQEIHAQMMGQVQIEVLTGLIKERFGVTVVFGEGNILYKETIARPVEGVGHFEPLRHYAEVHLLMEPGEPGSGVEVGSRCSEDILDLNWQRLIATHILEREHPGVLTGAPLTDVKITILTGRAHLKHTEGGDFRQATYRAIRQGLKSTECVLLEPMYHFLLEIPQESVGRAMTDIRKRAGTFETPEFTNRSGGEMAVLKGKAPVSTMQDYMTEVHAYTKGMGRLTLELAGYDVCHNSEEIIRAAGYDSEADADNPTSSVFCAHGAGFLVPWDEVEKYMHLDYAYTSDAEAQKDGIYYQTDGNAFDTKTAEHISGMGAANRSWEKSVAKMSSYELDQELADVYAREFGMSNADIEEQQRKKWSKKQEAVRQVHTKLDKKGKPIYPARGPQEKLMIVDGYNIIFAWEDLRELSRVNIDSARDRLKHILSNYQGYEGCRLVLVFDAYKIKDNSGKKEQWEGIEVVYTRTDETADAYIERLVHDEKGKYRIMVATNDGLEQLTVMGQGALRLSAGNLLDEIERTNQDIRGKCSGISDGS